MFTLCLGDSAEILPTLDAESIDALVCDPPAGIDFMYKKGSREWDGNRGGRDQWIAWLTGIMTECYRVLKPGAHGVVWALPRTSHWTATALENAGFEIRTIIHHHFATGWPKGINVGKAIDKELGAVRPTTGPYQYATRKGGKKVNTYSGDWGDRTLLHATVAGSDEALRWNDWHSELKPATEHWILVRKPLHEKTIAQQVLTTGTGALNIGASRVGEVPAGRFAPALLFSHAATCTPDGCDPACPCALIDEQSGTRTSGTGAKKKQSGAGYKPGAFGTESRPVGTPNVEYGDSGGFARFFPQFAWDREDEEVIFQCFVKASPRERNEGTEDLPQCVSGAYGEFAGDGRGRQTEHVARGNHHNTVKSKALMAWLCTLITPPEGVILDCFMGSGTTGVVARDLGFSFIGIEREPAYMAISQARLAQE